ncbi:MAG: alanine--tRNA ligase [Planctomycetota bacterium]
MSDLTAASVRRAFLDFFVERGHREVPSSPVAPLDDPTLLFTNAGMNQFKDVFLGTGERDYSRAVDTQKCIRVSGKHNDLEEVGMDTYHHTFFEMLGNWSFGDYFKEEAIVWAWGLLTEVWKLPKERLWVSVFAGDPDDGLPADEEAERIWREKTDIDPSRILRFSKEDNFWEMGDTGPCGPCSEIHIDRGAPGEDPADGADPKIGVNAGNERFIELWNLVFMEFNRLDDGSLRPLPAKHVDTGMGFERILSVLQGKSSNYDTDLFTPLFRAVEEISGKSYGSTQDPSDVAFRVIADHVRAASASFADGVLPSNTGRGYVMRRLIRRASRYGRQQLGLEEPFLWKLVPTVAEILGGAFPSIPERLEHVQLLIREEEKAFGRTLDRGLVRFAELAERVGSDGKVLPGDEAYELYATYGFPQDLVELMARERGMEVDLDAWETARAKHQEASRSEGTFRQILSAEELEELPATRSTYHDDGEPAERLETRVAGLFLRDGGHDALVLEASPFYAESGGQVGDSGRVEAADGTFRFEVRDTQKMGSVVVHLGSAEGSANPGLEVAASSDSARRDLTRKNHTATHLLHAALRTVLGDHVTQQGSYVGPDRLRFDFAHPRAVTPEEIDRIEELVNGEVARNRAVATTVEDLEAAKARGVMALFGEKYDERVRVVEVPGFSTELCGGTHVAAAGDIGTFVLVSEGAIQAGVRRVEALTGPAAVRWVQEQRALLRQTAQMLRAAPPELPGRIEQLQKQVKEAKKAQKKSSKADVGSALETVKAKLEDVAGVQSGVVPLELDQQGLRDLATRVQSLSDDLAVVLLGRAGDKVPWIVICRPGAQEKGLGSRELIPTLQEHLGGGGGGRPELAQGQGQRADAISAAEEALRDRIRAVLT